MTENPGCEASKTSISKKPHPNGQGFLSY